MTSDEMVRVLQVRGWRAAVVPVGRLADLLHSLSKETQFLLVTHSKRMMQSADMIYGVTMQEPGVSKIISVRLGGREQHRATA